MTKMWGRHSPDTKGLTVEFITRHEVPVSWQDAVAIVLETGDKIEAAGRNGVPRSRYVELMPGGAVELRAGRLRPGEPVGGLIAMLQEMLSGDAPTQLRAFLAAAGSTSSTLKSVPDFVDALRYYERPGREQMLAEVYGRGRLVLDSTDASEEPSEEAAADALAAARRRTRLRMAAVAVLAVVGGAALAERMSPGVIRSPASSLGRMAVGAWGQTRDGMVWLRGTVSSQVAALADSVQTPEDASAEDVDEGEVAGRQEVHDGQDRGGVTSARDGVEVERRRSAVRAQIGSAGFRPVSPAVESSDRDLHGDSTVLMASAVGSMSQSWVPRSVRGKRVVDAYVERMGPAEAPAVVGVGSRVFDGHDVGVVPPVAVKLPLPSELVNLSWDALPWGTRVGIVEAVVSESGEVEKVKLLSRDVSVHEAMLLSAVKTWRFDPARKDGVPVRYRHLIPVSVRRE